MKPIVDLGIPAVGVFLMLVVGWELTREDFGRVAVFPRPVVAGMLTQVPLRLLAVAAFRASHGRAALAEA